MTGTAAAAAVQAAAGQTPTPAPTPAPEPSPVPAPGTASAPSGTITGGYGATQSAPKGNGQSGKTAPRRTFEIPLRMRTPKSI